MRLPLASTILSRDSALSKDALLLNCYAEDSGEGMDIYKRPGVDNYQTYTGAGQGTYVWRGELYSIFGDLMTNKTTGATFQLSTNYPGQQYQFAQTAGQSGTATSAGTAWTLETNTPGWPTMAFAASCTFNGKMWISGGIDNLGADNAQVWSSADGATWVQATAAAAWAPRAGHQMLSFAGKLWIMGGTENVGTSSVNTVWNSSDGITWTQVTQTAAFVVRSYFSALVFNNKMWILGGASADGGGATHYNNVYSSPDGAAWTEVDAAADWAVRKTFKALNYNGQIWVMGGLDAALSTLYNDVWSSPDGDTWTQATAAAGWAARYGLEALNYNGFMWILGGLKTASAYDDDVWYSAAGVTWTQATAAAGWSARAFATAVVLNNKMWIMGGVNGVTYNDEVYSSDVDAARAATGPTAYLMIKNKNEGFYLAGTTPVLTQIADADYPAETVPGVLNLDGTFYVMDRAGVIFGSDLETPVSWNSLNFINSEAEPDVGIVIAKILNYVVALGAWSMEAFDDAVNTAPASPLDRIGGAYRQYGCASAGSAAYIENGLVFVSQSRLRGREVVRMLGLEIEKISTPSVEKVILADSLATVYSFCFKAGGHEFYILTLVASGVTLVCDLGNRMWYKWTSQIAGTAAALTTLTSSGTTATATLAAHGLVDGQVVLIATADQAGYNGTFIISVPDANTFTYTVASGLVTPATGAVTVTGYTDGYFRYINYIDNEGTDVVQHVTDGLLYQIGTTYTNDNDIRINSRARTDNYDGKTLNNKSFLALRLEADNVAANAYVRWTDDDYGTYNKFRKLSLNNNRKELRNLTSSRRRAFEVMHADNSAFIAQSLEPVMRSWRI